MSAEDKKTDRLTTLIKNSDRKQTSMDQESLEFDCLEYDTKFHFVFKTGKTEGARSILAASIERTIEDAESM